MNEATALVPVMDRSIQGFSLLSTAMAMDEARQQNQLLRKFISEILVEGIDYGAIPGTERTDPKTGVITARKVLHKPGAEHLCQLFRLRPNFVSLSVVEDFDKGLAFYRYECQLIHIQSGYVVGAGIGSCTSYESKYRFRNAGRVCPACGKETIIKGKAEYGGGWLCFAKKGGCGAKFGENHADILNQEVGKVQIDNLCDLWNTIDKMAQKRALIAATLITCGCSEYFTQDLDDDLPEPPPAPKQEPKRHQDTKSFHDDEKAPEPEAIPPASPPSREDQPTAPEASLSQPGSPRAKLAELQQAVLKAVNEVYRGSKKPDQICAEAFGRKVLFKDIAGQDMAEIFTAIERVKGMKS